METKKWISGSWNGSCGATLTKMVSPRPATSSTTRTNFSNKPMLLRPDQRHNYPFCQKLFPSKNKLGPKKKTNINSDSPASKMATWKLLPSELLTMPKAQTLPVANLASGVRKTWGNSRPTLVAWPVFSGRKFSHKAKVLAESLAGKWGLLPKFPKSTI